MATANTRSPGFGLLAQLTWGIGLLAPLPLVLYPIYSDLLRIQSMPVVVFAIAIWCLAIFTSLTIVFRRWNKVARFPSTRAFQILLILGFGCCCLGFAFGSIKLAIFGWVLQATAWLATHAEGKVIGNWMLPATFWTVSQVHAFWEAKLDTVYQQLLSAGVSSCFDILKIPFHSASSVFELAGWAFSVNEVLVNTPSVSWVLFACCIMVFWLRRPSVLLPAYMGIALFWMFAMHLSQLLTIGVAHHLYQKDLTAGWPFVLLAASTLLATIGLVLSSDRCLRVIFMPVPMEESVRGPSNPIHRVWNQLLLPLAVNKLEAQ